MQAALDHSLNFRDLQIRVAEMANLADHSGTKAAPPTDAINLDRVKRAINDAIADVARKASWTWLRQTMDITLSTDGSGSDCINTDATRYALHPMIVSAPYGRVTWRKSDNTQSGTVINTYTDRILRMRGDDNASTGTPRYCSVQPAYGGSTASGLRPRMEFRVWPKPSEAFVITATFSVTPLPMSLDSDRGIWPPYMDLPIIKKAYCNMLAYADPEFAAATLAADQAIGEARAQEGENRNRTLGRMGYGRPMPAVMHQETTITIPDIGFTME